MSIRTLRTNSALLIMITAISLVAVILLVMSLGESGSDSGPLQEFSASGEATPMWAGAAVAVPETARPQKPEVLEVHLDISYPMGGFLPFPSRGDDFSALRSVAQLTSDHLGRTYEGAGMPVRWRGVGESLRDLGPSPRIERSVFNGRATRLDLSIRDVLSNLRSGRTEAAALVTDLMATGGTTGPLGVAMELGKWLASDDVRSGLFHVGLLGVKAEYWGVIDAGACPEQQGLGCWFSERNPGYRRLPSVVRTPFYVLVIGRGRDAVDAVGRSVVTDISQLVRGRGIELETRWELLTEKSRRRDTTMSCRAFRRDSAGSVTSQFALFRDGSGTYQCVRNEPVILSCRLNEFQPESVEALVPGGGTRTPFRAAVKNDEIEVGVACGELMSQRASSDLRLDILASTYAQPTDSWASWSSETDELAESVGRTLQHRYFVEEVRLSPDNYRIVFPPLLRSGNQ